MVEGGGGAGSADCEKSLISLHFGKRAETLTNSEECRLKLGAKNSTVHFPNTTAGCSTVDLLSTGTVESDILLIFRKSGEIRSVREQQTVLVERFSGKFQSCHDGFFVCFVFVFRSWRAPDVPKLKPLAESRNRIKVVYVHIKICAF